MVEIDRGTMPIVRSDPERTNFARNMRGYLAPHAVKQLQRQFGWKNFRVLTITTRPAPHVLDDRGVATAPRSSQPRCVVARARDGGAQRLKEQAAEESREDAHWQVEPVATGDPARVVERGTAARHDTVDMRMVVQVLAPGVEHRDEADLGTEMLPSVRRVRRKSAEFEPF